MKLKEKLAIEAVSKWINSGDDKFNKSGHPFEHGFRMGFEKAKELAIEELYESNLDPTGFGQSVIDEIGEEDV